MSIMSSTYPHCCIPCGFFCSRRSNLVQHYSSKKHIDRKQNPEAIVKGKFQCQNCVKTYNSYQGLWYHKKVCLPPADAVADLVHPETDLHTKIDNLERVIDKLTDMIKNQQPSTTINNNNNMYF